MIIDVICCVLMGTLVVSHQQSLKFSTLYYPILAILSLVHYSSLFLLFIPEYSIHVFEFYFWVLFETNSFHKFLPPFPCCVHIILFLNYLHSLIFIYFILSFDYHRWVHPCFSHSVPRLVKVIRLFILYCLFHIFVHSADELFVGDY